MMLGESRMMELENGPTGQAVIKVIGVGGAGCNAVNTMIEEGLDCVEFIVANTDKQQLAQSLADTAIQIGESRSQGLGAGSDPNVGREAAQESQSILAEHIKGANMVFVTAGMGGGTGTGAAPVIAKIAKDMGVLTVAVVTKPFRFEGKKRKRLAEEGLNVLRGCVDTLITIPNERLLQMANENLTLVDAFKFANSVLLNAVRSISELITKTGMINTDFADVKTVMANQGTALMGTGVGTGPNRMIDAAQMAISSPLLDDIALKGATNVLLNITSPRDATLIEIGEAASLIEDELGEDGHVIWGQVFRDDDVDEVKITVIATGFNNVNNDYMDPSLSGQMPLQFGSNAYSNMANSGSYSGGFTKASKPDISAAIPAAAAPVYPSEPQQRTPSLTSDPLIDKMRDLNERGDSMYGSNTPSRTSGSFAPSQSSPRVADYSVPSSTRNEAISRESVAAQRVPASEATSALKDVISDDLETPTYLRNSSSKNNFLTD